MIATFAVASSSVDAGSVPLKVYWLTAGGVALLGVLGTLLSAWISSRVAKETNKSHEAQIEKQLAYERERAAADREHDLDKWRKQGRVAIYAKHLAAVNSLGDYALNTITRGHDGNLISMDEVFAHREEFYFWCSPAARNATEAIIEPSFSLRAELSAYMFDHHIADEVVSAHRLWAEYRDTLFEVLRADLALAT